MEITIKLTAEKWNVVMQALGNMPYAQVFELVSEIRSQATPQVDAKPVEE